MLINEDLLGRIIALAKRAGDEIMTIYNTGFTVKTKDDASPVTVADERAEKIILNAFKNDIRTPIPVISEEAAAAGTLPNLDGSTFWLVDPLDGTKEFINKNDEFTVNIALIENGVPVMGVVHTPALETTHWGWAEGAFKQSGTARLEKISCRAQPENGITAVVSRSHRGADIDDFLKAYTVAEEISAGSSLKFCTVAEGKADLYPRLGRTMEWDTGAGHAVLAAAGGKVVTLDGSALKYGKPIFENPHFIAASNDVPYPV